MPAASDVDATAADWSVEVPPAGPEPAAAASLADAEYESLRRLLLGQNQSTTLDRIATEGLDGMRVQGVADLLPEAVRLRESRDDALGVALSQTIETGLKASVERNPQPVVDAIFPVIGPAIRRSIQTTMAAAMDSINQSVNYGLSFRGLKWRFEAKRDGLTFGEVVLRHTLQYRVEQLLLVHRPSGILLNHTVAPEIQGGHNADLVSAMLTAIGQFVEDSFEVQNEELDAIQVGDLTVWLEPGPRAVLAAVIRGRPPQDLRVNLRSALEEVHKRFPRELESFSGDSFAFVSASELLEPCLDSQYAEPPSQGISPKLWLFIAVAVGLLGWWAWTAWQRHSHESTYMDALEAEPGIEVLRDERRGGALRLVGVRDPLAADPRSFLAGSGLDSADVSARWIPITSDEPEMVAERFKRAVQSPAGVTFRADAEGTVFAEGRSDTLWAAAARRALPTIEHARRLDVSGVESPIAPIAARLSQRKMMFEETGAISETGLAPIRADVRALATAAAKQPPGTVVLEIIGHTDDTGTAAFNQALGLRRAAAARAALAAELANLTVELQSRGAEETVSSGLSPESRRVTFRVR